MKAFKRNAVILTVLLFVCVAVYLNWAYNKNGEDADTLGGSSDAADTAGADDSAGAADAGLYYEENGDTQQVSNTVSEYFASVRLAREQARDKACETLSAVTNTEGASQETIDAALAEIAAVAETTVLEAELESLIMAKGFQECVVFISGDGIDVTVQSPAEGMSSAAVARITDIVLEKTDFNAADLKIIEVK